MILQTLIAVTIVSFLSLLGALFVSLRKRTVEKVITYSVALSSGVLLGSVFFDLLPESLELLPDAALALTLVGFVSFFILEKLISWHHHIEGDHPGNERPVAYLTLIGDALHNFADGAVIAAAFFASPAVGLSTTVAVVAHEIPHELSDFTILLHGGMDKKKALLYNFISATTAIAGALVMLVVQAKFAQVEKVLVPFAAGNFIYIAASDLVPELLQKRTIHISVVQIAWLLAGIALIYLVGIATS